jgi:hypothetical protein
MSWSSDLEALALQAGKLNPTAGAALDLISAVLSVYDAATTPNLPAELASADAAADVAEAAKFPPIMTTAPDGTPQPEVVGIVNQAMAIARQASAECEAEGCARPETGLAYVKNALAMARHMMTLGPSARPPSKAAP